MVYYNIRTSIIWGLLNSALSFSPVVSCCWLFGCTSWSFRGLRSKRCYGGLKGRRRRHIHINTHRFSCPLQSACKAVCRTERHLFPLLVSTEPTTKRYLALMQRHSTQRINNMKTACHPKNRRPAVDMKLKRIVSPPPR